MHLTSRNLGDPAVSHPPSAWEELAYRFEAVRQWDRAMQAWKKAMSSSAGHSRRSRYKAKATVAEQRAKEK